MGRIVEHEGVIDGGPVHLLSAGGEGPGLLLLHGWADGAVVWRRLLAALSDHYRGVAPDLPGFGRSAPTAAAGGIGAIAARMRATAKAHLPSPVTLIGHSLGGLVALHLALREPAWVRALVLVNPAWDPAGMAAVVPPPLRHRTTALPLLIASRPLHGAMVRALAPLLARGGPRHQDQLRRWLCYDQAEPWWLARTVQMLVESDLPAPVEQVRQPSLVVVGGRDRTIPPPLSARLAARLPQGRIAQLSASGHHPMEDDFEQFLAVVTPFLAAYARGEQAPA